MPNILINGATLLDAQRVVRPTVLTWNRLEPLPLSTDLEPGLSAAVADPLWLLARQWQFLEFAGEDAGSPIDVRVSGESAMLTRYTPGAITTGAAAPPPRAYDPTALPLETLVEREPAREAHPRLAAEAGLHLMRLLQAARLDAVAEAYRAKFPLLLPRDADVIGDDDGAEWTALARDRALDARALLRALAPLRNASGVLLALPADPPVADAQNVALRVLQTWIRSVASSISEAPIDAWNARRQEYAFSVTAPVGQRNVTMIADEYADGDLDWYSFRARVDASVTATPAPVIAHAPTIPTPVDYRGKPADRYWEFEDARVNFGAIDAGPTDLSRLLLMEFALVYGNDWFVVPVRLPVGSLFRVSGFSVRDTFGVETKVSRMRNAGGAAWSLFELSDAGATIGANRQNARDLFYLAPTIASRLEGAPLEEIVLFRDEMANMAWAAERRVPGVSGDAYDRRTEAERRAAGQVLTQPASDATIAYRLATSVPDYWIPFVPVPDEGSTPGINPVIQLERRVIRRTERDGVVREVHPKGVLLRTDPSLPPGQERALRIEEEEVPRDGAIVERRFQFARWINGESLLWLGRRKSAGRGEGSSGLRYDVLAREEPSVE